MHRVVWLTDLHLNHCQDDYVEQYFGEVLEHKPDSLLISGDISESFQLIRYLRWMDSFFPCPVYFVLGNHDFYFARIGFVRGQVEKLCDDREQLTYLSISDPVSLTTDVGLVGHDGWSDGRIGDYRSSLVMMHDYKLIEDLKGLKKAERWDKLKSLGDDAAAHIRSVLPKCLDKHNQAILLTHVPPLREACWHEGEISDDNWAPHFTCKAMGDAILEIMAERPDKRLRVLCGHTHGAGTCQPLENVEIITGGATYGRPAITRVFELD